MGFKKFISIQLHGTNKNIWRLILCTAVAFILVLALLVTAVISDVISEPQTPYYIGGGASVSAMKVLPTTETDKPKSSGKQIAITFDDGPHNVYTKNIVDELEKYGFHATFFVVGNRIDGTEYSGGSTLKYVLDNGHEVGIHGYTHSTSRYYDTCSDAIFKSELGDTLNAIHKIKSDYNVTLMRPVGGRITSERTKNCGYSVIMWSVDSNDWKYKTPAGNSENIDTIVNNVMSGLKEGSIILMHDIYENTYEALKIILERISKEGYEVVTVSELLGNAEAGVKYSQR